MTIYGVVWRAPAAEKRGPFAPWNTGRIMSSISKATTPIQGSPRPTAGIFMTSGKPGSGAPAALTAWMYPLPPAWMRSPMRKPSMAAPRASAVRGAVVGAASDTMLDPVREHLRQTGGAHLRGRRAMVVGDAMEREAGAIEQGISRGGVAVARLSHRARDGEPAPVRGDGDRRSGMGPEGAHASGGILEIEPLVVHVATERIGKPGRCHGGRRGRRPVHVGPARGPIRRGVHVAARVLLHAQREP